MTPSMPRSSKRPSVASASRVFTRRDAKPHAFDRQLGDVERLWPTKKDVQGIEQQSSAKRSKLERCSS